MLHSHECITVLLFLYRSKNFNLSVSLCCDLAQTHDILQLRFVLVWSVFCVENMRPNSWFCCSWKNPFRSSRVYLFSCWLHDASFKGELAAVRYAQKVSCTRHKSRFVNRNDHAMIKKCSVTTHIPWTFLVENKHTETLISLFIYFFYSLVFTCFTLYFGVSTHTVIHAKMHMWYTCVLLQPFTVLTLSPAADKHPEGEKKKKHHESKGPFPNPHKLRVTWLQWDDYTLLARILWRLLTGPHYIGSHLWLNVSTSFLPVCMCDLPAITAAGGRGGGGWGGADQDSCGLVFCRQLNSESQWFDFKPCLYFMHISKTRIQSSLQRTERA